MRNEIAIASRIRSLLSSSADDSSSRGMRLISICFAVSYGSSKLPSTQRTPWLTRLRASRSNS